MRKTNLWVKMFLFLVPVMFVALPVAVIATEGDDNSGDDSSNSASTTSTTTVSTGSIEEILKQIIALIESMVESQKALIQTIKEDQKQQRQWQQQSGQGGYGGYGGGGYGSGGSNQENKLLASIIKQLLKGQTQPRDPFTGAPWMNQGGLSGQGGGSFPYDQSAIDRLRQIPGVRNVSVVDSGASSSDDPLGGILGGTAPWNRPGTGTAASTNFGGTISSVRHCQDLPLPQNPCSPREINPRATNPTPNFAPEMTSVSADREFLNVKNEAGGGTPVFMIWSISPGPRPLGNTCMTGKDVEGLVNQRILGKKSPMADEPACWVLPAFGVGACDNMGRLPRIIQADSNGCV